MSAMSIFCTPNSRFIFHLRYDYKPNKKKKKRHHLPENYSKENRLYFGGEHPVELPIDQHPVITDTSLSVKNKLNEDTK